MLDRSTALFLDIDGTLAEFADDPDAVDFPDALRTLLLDLAAALGGAVALVSGRSLDSIARLTRDLALPMAGQHGAEWQFPGKAPVRLPIPQGLDTLRTQLAALAAGRPDLRLEDKGMSLALHYQPSTADEARLAESLEYMGGQGFELLRGRRVLELRPRGVHKGAALDRFMAAPPFAGRVPCYLGDDWTDEDGFEASLLQGGHAIRVGGVRAGSKAEAFLDDPAAARGWLQASLARL